MELEPSVTPIDATTDSSVVSGSGLIPSGPVTLLSEHDRTPVIARTTTASLKSVRFIVGPSNRATGFSEVAMFPARVSAVYLARNMGRAFATNNAVLTARFYVRQAKRSFRHFSMR
jgi:hypothetical protein